MKIAVLAKFNSIAVWNSMKLHIDMMVDANFDVEIYLPINQKNDLIQEKYRSICKTYKKNLRELLKNDANITHIWCPDLFSVLQISKFKLNLKIIFWIQGSAPDESFLRHGSKIRKNILTYLEHKAIKKSHYLIYVSESMKVYYTNKYKLQVNSSIVVPCISEYYNYTNDQVERIKNSFVYIGGLSEWQCFKEILYIYKQIHREDYTFHIITIEVEKARSLVLQILPEYIENIKIYSIVDRSKIPYILNQFEYGFLIRKDSPVNYVSSPIKFLEYISCGVNVIMTRAIPSYSRIIEENKIGTVINLDQISSIDLQPYSPNAKKIYNQLFDRKIFIKKYIEIIN
jgi:hypothetical protein